MSYATLFCLLVSVVVAHSQVTVPCPRHCEFPRNKAECIQCLNGGYSDVVSGKGGLFMGHRNLWNKLQTGAYTDWEDGRCWINIKGISDKDICHEIGPYIFGQNRCPGFEKASFKVLTNNCWAKFKKP